MKITRLPNESLEIQERWAFLKTGCAIGAVLLPVVIVLAELNEDSMRLGRLAGGALGTILLLWIAAVLKDRRFFFDAAEKLLTWDQRNWFGSQGGRIPFSDIKQVLVTSQRTRDSDHRVGGYDVNYGAILVTGAGTIPLTGTHSSSKQEYERLAEAVLAVLSRPDNTPKTEDEVAGLIAAGRMIDAVALIRAEKGLGLLEARELAAEIKRAQEASPKG